MFINFSTFISKRICFLILSKVIYCISSILLFFVKNKERNSLFFNIKPLFGYTSPSIIFSLFKFILLIILSMDNISLLISFILILSYSSLFSKKFSISLFSANSKRVVFISSKSKVLINID